ncbi:signal peptidase II [Kistimonas asteriae]|uniref:signal peptidase II n=1 Tax=Kistimonas asteriae TaxID=517724 RepID=UPI001BA987B7|nr:signal peptidase II [Kistimonas asteriae]
MTALHSSRSYPMLRWLWLSVVVIVLDQLSKYYFNNHFSLYEQVPVTPFFSFTLAYNTGAAFSFLSDASGWQRWFFVSIALIVSVVLVIWMKRLRSDEKLQAVALALILGGALGNVWDRIALGHVVDFLLFYYDRYYFPAFNLADSAITLGAGLLILDMFIHPQPTDTDKDRQNT